MLPLVSASGAVALCRAQGRVTDGVLNLGRQSLALGMAIPNQSDWRAIGAPGWISS